jgi:hypothetical protein
MINPLAPGLIPGVLSKTRITIYFFHANSYMHKTHTHKAKDVGKTLSLLYKSGQN